MRSKPSTIAQKLLNLYRAEHVIYGGWSALNPVFVAEATPEVMTELVNLPTGSKLVQHIQNLRSGKTSMDSIASELLPYGGLMNQAVASTQLTEAELHELASALAEFVPDANGLERIQSLSVVKKFGEEWQVGIRAALASDQHLSTQWNSVVQTARAYYLWKIATDILNAPLSERARAQVQADLPEYETYLPMFGDAGRELLNKLRTFVSSI